MNPTVKKGLLIGAAVIDAAATIFLFTLSIIMLATMPNEAAMFPGEQWTDACVRINGNFIGWLQANPTVYLCACVLPLIILLGANIAFLIVYVKKAGKKKAVGLSDLSEEEKEALKAELLKDLNNK